MEPPPEEWPADASTLVDLARADVFADAAVCCPQLLVSPSVWREAVEDGERVGAAEVPRIRAAEQRGLLRRVTLTSRERALAGAIATEHGLGAGESEAPAIGLTLGRAIIDEGRASRVAAAIGVPSLSTLLLPAFGRRRGGLGESDAIALLRRLAVVAVAGARADAVFEIEQFIREERDED